MISIIVPTYKKEESELKNFLNTVLSQEGDYEVIISDVETPGIDGIIKQVSNQNRKNGKLVCLKNDTTVGNVSRAHAMNHGADIARGEILLFLHSDLVLPEKALLLIENVINNSASVAGGFLKQYDKKKILMYLTEAALNFRAKYGKRLVGTNAMFIRSDVFEQIRFNDRYLEDVDLSDTLIEIFGKQRISVIEDHVTVSSEKYVSRGHVKSILINSIVMILYRLFKVDNSRLEKFYRLSKDTSYFCIIKSAVKLWVEEK